MAFDKKEEFKSSKIAKASVKSCYTPVVLWKLLLHKIKDLCSLQVLGNKLSEILFQLIISLPIVIGIHDLMPTFQLRCMTHTNMDMGLATFIICKTRSQALPHGVITLGHSIFFNGDSACPFSICICKIQS